MMTDPSKLWKIFGIVLVAVLTAAGWITHLALQHARAEIAISEKSIQESKVRFAVSRMDSFVDRIIATESAQPYFNYTAFYPGEPAYSLEYELFSSDYEVRFEGRTLVPSPLLKEHSPYVRIHFQVDSSDVLTSPQVPTWPHHKLGEAQLSASRQALMTSHLDVLDDGVSWVRLQAHVPELPRRNKSEEPDPLTKKPKTSKKGKKAVLEIKTQPLRIVQGPMRIFWIGDKLLFARRVIVKDEAFFQGGWLDWAKLQKDLPIEVADILPEAKLVATVASRSHPDEPVLGAIPARVRTGEIPGSAKAPRSVETSLIVAWFALLVAALTAGGMILGVMRLSERRATFVSAVSHELRTPLTTFRIYTEALLEGKVKEPEKQKLYLETLHREANRISRMAENVLRYSKLEQQIPADEVDSVRVGEFFTHLLEIVRPLCAQSGIAMRDEIDEDVRGRFVYTEVTAMEQVMMNLIENTCKYASETKNPKLLLQCVRVGKKIEFHVRDNGPGIPKGAEDQIFEPFAKFTVKGDPTAPGVGLGLALARRMARHLGGDLVHRPVNGPGALFVFIMPLRTKLPAKLAEGS